MQCDESRVSGRALSNNALLSYLSNLSNALPAQPMFEKVSRAIFLAEYFGAFSLIQLATIKISIIIMNIAKR